MAGVSPRFRQDLVAVAAEEDGVAYVDVHDPGSGTQFRFYDFEYALATQMDGRPVDDIVVWAASSYGMELTREGVEEFSRQLSGLGFLEPPAGDEGAAAEADESSQTVSHLVNEAVSQVAALPTRRDRGDEGPAGFGDFSPRDVPGADETTADAEWRAADGERTVSGDPLSDLFAGRESARPAPSLPEAFESPPPASAQEAVNEFNDSEATSHWVPPFASDQKREPSHWAADLNNDLQPASAPPPSPAFPANLPPASETLLGFGAAALGSSGEPFGRLAPRRGRPAGALTPTPGAAATPSLATPPPRKMEMASSALPTPPPTLTPPPTPPPIVPLPPATMPMLPIERRQPPAPEEVVMSAFQQNAVAADANLNPNAPPRAQFRAPIEPPRSSRGPKIAVVIMLILAAGAGIAYYLWTSSVAAAAVKHVRVLSPKPAAVYRWFDSTGRVAGGELRTLAFEGGGRVTDVLPAGSSFSAGEIIARLQGAALVESDVSRHRARLLFYQQMRDSMRATNNAPELRQAEIKIGIKTDLLAEAEALLTPRVIRPVEPGQVIEVLVKPGDSIDPHVAALKINPGRLRGEFVLAAADAATARALAFCRVEVAGQAPTASIAPARRGDEASAADSGPPQAGVSARFVDCQQKAAMADAAASAVGDRVVSVELPPGAAVTVGQPLRLARARFDGVFPIPRSAVVRSSDGDRVFVATSGGIAEARAVTLADTSGADLLVTQGLDVGDAVIVDGPGDLRDGARIAVDR